MKHCPHCKESELTALSELSSFALACPVCHGLWLTKPALTQIGHELPSRGWFDVALWEQEELLKAMPSTLVCPADQSALVHITWNKTVEADMCASCGGMWLPKGEYQKIPALFTELADDAVMKDHGTLLSHQLALFFEGRKTAADEVRDLKDLLKFLEYRFAAKHPILTELIEGLPFAS